MYSYRHPLQTSFTFDWDTVWIHSHMVHLSDEHWGTLIKWWCKTKKTLYNFTCILSSSVYPPIIAQKPSKKSSPVRLKSRQMISGGFVKEEDIANLSNLDHKCKTCDIFISSSAFICWGSRLLTIQKNWPRRMKSQWVKMLRRPIQVPSYHFPWFA